MEVFMEVAFLDRKSLWADEPECIGKAGKPHF